MTGKERIERIIHRQPVDRPAWTTLADAETRSCMSRDLRALSTLDFYRHVGCDILQFGNYGMPPELVVKSPCRAVGTDTDTEVEVTSDGTRYQRLNTSWGTLTSAFKHGHPVKHPVTTIEGLRVLKQLWMNTRYQEDPDGGNWNQVVEAIGQDGVFCHTFGPSPVQQLLQLDMGVEGFYTLLRDHREETEELLSLMHDRRKQEYEMVARRMPVEVGIPVENTSTTMVSPSVYERYSLPQIRDYVDILHRHGRLAVLHMCGHLKALLPLIKQTGMDGINALTPPTVGDTPYEHALDVLGEDVLLLGSVFQPSVIQNANVVRDDVQAELNRMYTPRVRNAHFLLWIGVDGLPTPIERFLFVRDWFESQGARTV